MRESRTQVARTRGQASTVPGGPVLARRWSRLRADDDLRRSQSPGDAGARMDRALAGRSRLSFQASGLAACVVERDGWCTRDRAGRSARAHGDRGPIRQREPCGAGALRPAPGALGSRTARPSRSRRLGRVNRRRGVLRLCGHSGLARPGARGGRGDREGAPLAFRTMGRHRPPFGERARCRLARPGRGPRRGRLRGVDGANRRLPVRLAPGELRRVPVAARQRSALLRPSIAARLRELGRARAAARPRRDG